MSAAHLLRDEEPDPGSRIRVCERCGKEKPTRRIDGEDRCAACDAAIHAGEAIKDIWAENKV